MASNDIPKIPKEITDAPLVSSTGILVKDRFTNSRAYADAAWNIAMYYINLLGGITYTIPWSPIIMPDVPTPSIVAQKPGPLVITPIDITLPEFPLGIPEFVDVEVDIPPAPQFTGTPPILAIPDPPDVEWPIFTKEVPPTSDVVIPGSPDVNLPPVPKLVDISIPSPPDFQMPHFEGEPPVALGPAPEPQFVWNEAEYSTELLTELSKKLLSDLINGGSGLDVATETAIYDRARSRQIVDNERMYDETLNYFSSRGHTIPPGALNGALVEIRNKILQVLEDLENDILVNQSKLAQENTHFIISTGIAYEKALMDHTNQVNQRAFEAAKYVVEYVIILYRVKVEAYIAELEAYKVYAQVFEARIRAEIAKAEFYKAQIEGLRLNVDLQKAAIDIYIAQVQGINALISLYATQMQAANIQAGVNKTIIEGYAVEVQAYATKNAAIVSRYEAYQAQIAGESEKVKMYMAEAQAYESIVDGYKAKADVELTRVSVEIEKLKGKIQIYLGAVDKYKEDIQAAVAKGKFLADEQGLRVSVYEATSQQYAVEVDGLIKAYLGEVEEIKGNIELQLKNAEIAVQSVIAQYELTSKALESGARVSAQLASSAMSAVSASAHLNYGEQRSDARGWQAGWTARTGVTARYDHDVTKHDITRAFSEIHRYNTPDAHQLPIS